MDLLLAVIHLIAIEVVTVDVSFKITQLRAFIRFWKYLEARMLYTAVNISRYYTGFNDGMMHFQFSSIICILKINLAIY